MVERRLVVDHAGFSYSGVFDLNELHELIDKLVTEKGYQKREMTNQEHVREDGKYIELVIQPWRRITDYIRHVIKLRIRIRKMKSVTMQQDGRDVKLQQGDIFVTMDAWLETDYEDRWEQKPFYLVLRTTFDKFFYQSPNKEREGELSSAANFVLGNVKAFLDLYRHRYG